MRQSRRPSHLIAAGLALLLAACGGSFSSHNPIAPTPITTSRATLSGTVTDRSSGAPLGNATVTVIDGPSALRVATTDGAGSFRFEDMAKAGFNVRTTRDGYREAIQGVNLGNDMTIGVAMTRAPLSLSGSFRGSFAQTINGTIIPPIPVSLATISQTGLSFSGTFTASALTGTFSGVLSDDSVGATVSGVMRLRSPSASGNVQCTGSGAFTGSTTSLAVTMRMPLLPLENCAGAVTEITVSLTRVTAS